MDQEKRYSLRIKKQVDTQYRNLVDDKEVWVTLSVRNISEAGACVLIDKFPLIGEEILLRLRTPLNPNKWFRINTKVIDVDIFMKKTYLARLKFIDLKDEYQEQLKEYVDFYLKRGKHQ
ncbi:MAG: PilZ domain-containing protein [Candidatus Omnitrophota bacterium]|nr:PilZ domain-containing protein [Candidatus Omnitrophota bacterium]MBU1929210.1 PilZ domain-containing protein [Candidatus Omnitrophota bacterium]MBU2034541.1 PilZ domain-containing protein [Candidatus Omnitrophota bacterium]MBU2221204.1 PilZ domain-containing protein [Candidatus Omnitrophota bacterium]